jgi:hypothetical protein
VRASTASGGLSSPSRRSDSAKITSTPIVGAPRSRMRASSVATVSRRHGHCPIVDRLRSSTSTMATRPLGACAAIARASRS